MVGHMFKSAVMALGLVALAQAQAAKDVCPTVKDTGTSTGTIQTIDGIPMYIATPSGNNKKSDKAILYISDVLGLPLLQNRLLADSFADAGYRVIMPDVFLGDAWNEVEDIQVWKSRHPDSETDTVLAKTVKYMKEQLQITKIGGVGYCFGGKFVPRMMAGQTGVAGRNGVSTGFIAHPTFLAPNEISAVKGPLSIAAGELDATFNAADRRNAEDILSAKNAQIFETRLFSNAPHAFAVRTNMSNPELRFAKEASFRQAVEWMNAWL